jgi:hypothetical protein
MLEPPDYRQCQCLIRPAHSPLSFGPRPKYQRCDLTPAYLATEVVPGEDGVCGVMTLCMECAIKMMENADLRKRVRLEPIPHVDV